MIKTKKLSLLQFLSLLFYVSFFIDLGEGVIYQHGKVLITTDFPSGYACEDVAFHHTFTGSEAIQVQATVSGNSTDRHGGVAVWVESLTKQKFRACVLRNGDLVNNTVEVNWLATQRAPQGVYKGSLSFDMWTTGTKCKKLTFSSKLEDPQVYVTARHQTTGLVQDATSVWVEDTTQSDVTVCMREFETFSGGHENLIVDWLVFVDHPQSWNVTASGNISFANDQQAEKDTNFAFCQTQNFSEPHYAPPVILATVSHKYDLNDSSSIPAKHNSLNIWLENVTRTDFRVCVKDLVPYGENHDPLEVQYVIIGDLDPCINVTCDYHAVCKAIGPYEARCVCVTDCPSITESVCATNGKSFDNKCWLQLEICENRSNFTYFHPGSCKGFPVLKGHIDLAHDPEWTESRCDMVQFKPYTFYADKKVHIQLTVNHINHTAPEHVHDAVASWVEDVSDQNFTVCVQVTGRNTRPEEPLAGVDWLAYQGSPSGGVVGISKMKNWWTGTQCRTVNIPESPFSTPPIVLVTAEHEREGIRYDAASVWAEDITTNSFKVCSRELQSFDGLHRDIDLNWLAFEEVDNPLFNEHGAVTFDFQSLPSNQISSADCKTLAFNGTYSHLPNVQITGTHSTSGGNKIDPDNNGISAWVESMNLTHFKICAIEYKVNQYDPVTVHFAVLPDICPGDWHYFRGYCYQTQLACTGWSNASLSCQSKGADITSVKDQEENVYIQHLHGGEKTWVGLTDMRQEGKFIWSDNLNSLFRFWATGQPNDFGNADCVHALGVEQHYRWNDVKCTDCLPYTCKIDYDECQNSPCLNGATCTDEDGDFTCTCAEGYTGRHCETRVPGCLNYVSLNDSTRNVNYGYGSRCDRGYDGKTWYRLVGLSGTKMAAYCAPYQHCGTQYPGWLNGNHPTVEEGIVTRRICFRYAHYSCCHWDTYIKVRNCGGFYTYQFVNTPSCNFAYCGVN